VESLGDSFYGEAVAACSISFVQRIYGFLNLLVGDILYDCLNPLGRQRLLRGEKQSFDYGLVIVI
jgi:hypothetical protein